MKTCSASPIIAEERAKQHNVLADRLTEHLRRNGTPSNGEATVRLDERTANLIYEASPRRALSDLVLPPVVEETCLDLIEEQQRADVLRSYDLEPRHRILLEGPPGNGKTSLAEALASEMMVPLLVVRYEGVIGAYLGETAVRLRKVFDYACTRKCVLFFDEFDTLGKERGDTHETGEIKRVVSSLLLQIDALPSHVVVITATNHAELLDRAVWRRFEARMTLPTPTRDRLEQWFTDFEARIAPDIEMPYRPSTMAKKLLGASFAEAEDFGQMLLRRYVLDLPGADIKSIVKACVTQWQARTQPS